MALYEIQKSKYPHKYQVIVQDYKTRDDGSSIVLNGEEKLVKFGNQDYTDYLQTIHYSVNTE